jgi:hypothetical protein
MVSFGFGAVPIESFGLMLLTALVLAAGFVLSSYVMLPASSNGNKPSLMSSLPSRFFIGLFLFLFVFKMVTLVTGSSSIGLLAFAVISAFGIVLLVQTWRAASPFPGWSRNDRQLAQIAFAYLPLTLALGIVLATVTRWRYVDPIYDQIAVHIAAHKDIPVINRHYAQSMLGSVLLLPVKAETAEARAAINIWLCMSLVAFSWLVLEIM